MALSPGDRVLNGGCGLGALTGRLVDAVDGSGAGAGQGEVVGVDISEDAIAACNRLAAALRLAPAARFAVGDAYVKLVFGGTVRG